MLVSNVVKFDENIEGTINRNKNTTTFVLQVPKDMKKFKIKIGDNTVSMKDGEIEKIDNTHLSLLNVNLIFLAITLICLFHFYQKLPIAAHGIISLLHF